jgi:hypothetical protein
MVLNFYQPDFLRGVRSIQAIHRAREVIQPENLMMRALCKINLQKNPCKMQGLL